MTKDEAKELSYILKAYSEGKIIEISNNGSQWAELNMSYPNTVFKYNQYRIKPEPKLVPFTFEDNLLFRDKWVRSKELTALSRISWFGPARISLGILDYTYKELLDNYEFEDKSPCGKYIND